MWNVQVLSLARSKLSSERSNQEFVFTALLPTYVNKLEVGPNCTVPRKVITIALS